MSETNIKAELERIRSISLEDLRQGKFNALILGFQGTGKTHLLKTCRLPVLIHSFDPGGTKHLRKEMLEGKIVADTRFEKEDMNDPTAYSLWEDEFFRLRSMNAFAEVGTYCIDSFTTWFDALKDQICRRKGLPTKLAAQYRGATGRAVGLLEQQDWQVAGNIVKDMTKLCADLPCDFILTGHTLLEKEEVSGRMIAFFNAIPSLRINVPILFDEIYIMEAEETTAGIRRSLLTAPTGRYIARTRIGSEKFELHEEPNIKHLLKKAGMGLDDKPLLSVKR